MAVAVTLRRNGASERPGILQMGFRDRTAQQYNTRGCHHVQSSRTAPPADPCPLQQSASATQYKLSVRCLVAEVTVGPSVASSRIRIAERAAASVAGVGLAVAGGAAVGATVCASASSHHDQTRTLRCRSDYRTYRLRAMWKGTLANI